MTEIVVYDIPADEVQKGVFIVKDPFLVDRELFKGVTGNAFGYYKKTYEGMELCMSACDMNQYHKLFEGNKVLNRLLHTGRNTKRLRNKKSPTPGGPYNRTISINLYLNFVM